MPHFANIPFGGSAVRNQQEARALTLGVTRSEFDFIASNEFSGTNKFIRKTPIIDAFLDELSATNNQQERDRLLLARAGNNPAFAGRAAEKASRAEVVRLGRRRGFTSTIRGGAAGRGANSFLQPLGGPGNPESRQFLGG